MVVNYKGYQSSIKQLPGGSPQGTLLALLLFLVMINDLGFDSQFKKNVKVANEIHLKYVDDLTYATAVNLAENLVDIPQNLRVHPENYHERTGQIIPFEKNILQRQMHETVEYANRNDMKINYKKTKTMLFNPCRSLDFHPGIDVLGNKIEYVEQFRLLGLIITPDLKWTANTNHLVSKAFKRLWILRRLKNLGANRNSLLDIYTKQIRCITELAVPVWQGSLTLREKAQFERVQRCAAHIILGHEYVSYQNALEVLGLHSLEERRKALCLKFALKAERNAKFKPWFKLNTQIQRTRRKPTKYVPVKSKHERLDKGPIGFLTNILNSHYQSKSI